MADLGVLVARLDPALIVPTCEEVFYLAVAAERLGLSDRVFAPAPAVLRQLHSKVAFAALAQSAGLAVPATRRVTSVAQLDAWRAQAPELVFKPEFSRFASHTRIRPQPAALDRLVPSPEQPWAVQDFVAGEELCLWSAAISGEIVGFAAYRPRWRLGRSASFYFEAETDPMLIEIPRAIARATAATGQLSFDVIRRADGVVLPIECNPRGISGIHLFDAAPELALALMGQGELALPAPAMWLLGAPQALVSGQWRAFRRDMARSRDVLARTGEPWAALGALLDAVRFSMIGLGRGRSASGQSTDDIEWNGEAIG